MSLPKTKRAMLTRIKELEEQIAALRKEIAALKRESPAPTATG